MRGRDRLRDLSMHRRNSIARAAVPKQAQNPPFDTNRPHRSSIAAKKKRPAIAGRFEVKTRD
ncbi:hypothetical protein ASD86_13190 [Lysobacter sp. Root690]|nr:hypothetical protein ASD86_13190 [Lysobacter sp. Root690]